MAQYKIKKGKLAKLKDYGFKELSTCYYKDLGRDWVLRVDKNTKQIKCWNIMNGKTKSVVPYITDLLKEFTIGA